MLSSITISQSIKTLVEIENLKFFPEKIDEQLHVLNANVNVEASKQVTVQGFMATGQSLLLLQEQLGYRLRGLRQTDNIRINVSANPVLQHYGLYCGCPCHRDQTVALKQSPRSFDRFIGSLFFGYILEVELVVSYHNFSNRISAATALCRNRFSQAHSQLIKAVMQQSVVYCRRDCQIHPS